MAKLDEIADTVREHTTEIALNTHCIAELRKMVEKHINRHFLMMVAVIGNTIVLLGGIITLVVQLAG